MQAEVERVARAICEAAGVDVETSWPVYVVYAEAAIEAVDEHRSEVMLTAASSLLSRAQRVIAEHSKNSARAIAS